MRIEVLEDLIQVYELTTKEAFALVQKLQSAIVVEKLLDVEELGDAVDVVCIRL